LSLARTVGSRRADDLRAVPSHFCSAQGRVEFQPDGRAALAQRGAGLRRFPCRSRPSAR